MLKFGSIRLKSQGNDKVFFFYWYISNDLYERIDIISDTSKYNVINTISCEASLYRGKSELIYGDKNLIKDFLSIKHKASYLHIKEDKQVSVDGKDFIMEITKSAEDTGIFYYNKLVNGRLEREVYVTEIGEIDTAKITYESSNIELLRPINLNLYYSVTIGEDKIVKTAKSGDYEYLPLDELLRRYPEVKHVYDEDYVVITSYEEAIERFEIWKNSKEQLKSFDIESMDTNWGPYSSNRITGIFLGFGTHWSTYFPFRQDNFEYNLPLDFMRKIFDAINNQPPYPEVIMLAHNVQFELSGFYQEFREYIRCDVDTYLLSVLVDPIIKKNSHTLKSITAKVDGRFYLTLNQIFVGKVAFNVLPPEIVKIYGCPDATSPAKIYPYLMDKLPKDEQYVLSLENKLPVICMMETFYGLRMDQERLTSLIEDEEWKIKRLGDLFRQIHHTSKNINSYDVMKEIIYDRLRCRVEVTTQKGLPATSKFAIDRIIELGTKKIEEGTPIPEDIVDRHGEVILSGKDLASNKYPSLVIYQAYKKCCKEYGALKRLKSHSDRDFFKFYINQVGAGSNRQTSDAHQFSDTMKSCVLADSPHHQLVSCDWKQIELRILAALAGQKDLLDLMADPNVDIHRAILSIIQNKPIYMISEEDRKAGKSVNFGVVYMMTKYGLAKKDFGPGYTLANLLEEERKITDFFNGLPLIKKYLDSNLEFLKTHGYIKTAFNYYRFFPELLDPTLDSKKAQSLLRSGNNTPVQGTGAGLLKISMTLVWNYIRKKGWDKEKDYDGVMLPKARIMLPIHDEILFSYDKDEITMEEIIDMFKECMELDIDGFPPLFAAPAFINNWYDGKNPIYEVDIPLRDKIVEEYHKGNYMLTGHSYLDVLNEYRDNELREYMERLISKYKTVDEVTKHVTDDSLTHTLIETLISDKKERKKFTHIERIHEAVKRYFEKLENNGKLDIIKNSAYAEDEQDKVEFMEVDEWAKNYAHIDADGNIIDEEIDEASSEGEDDGNYMELLPIEQRFVPKCTCIYLMNECIVDLTDYDTATVGNSIHLALQKLTSPSEFYNLIYIIGARQIKTHKKIGYIPDKIDEIFALYANKEDEKDAVYGS